MTLEEIKAQALHTYRGSADRLRERALGLPSSSDRDALLVRVEAFATMLAGLSDEEVLDFRGPWRGEQWEIGSLIEDLINPYLREDALVDGAVYRIKARNASVGIWRAAQRGFEIPRNKFDRLYLFVEYHWDASRAHGTVKPWERLQDIPSDEERDEVKRLFWLLELQKNHPF